MDGSIGSTARLTSPGVCDVESTTERDRPGRSVDTRTRPVGESSPVDAASFWETEWLSALERNGARAASDAERLELPPLAIAVDGEVWTLRRGDRTLEVVAGSDATALRVSLDADGFTDLVHERRTAIGLGIAARVDGEGNANAAFWAWDAVLRSPSTAVASTDPAT